MKLTTIAALALCLAACANVDDLTRKTPIAEFESNKSVSVVAECIRDAWEKQRIGIEGNGASLTRAGDTLTVISPVSNNPAEIAMIAIKGDGSVVSIRSAQQLDLGGREGRRIEAARSCK